MLLWPHYREMLKKTPASEAHPDTLHPDAEFHTTISFCQGWCPCCKLLEWCDYTEGRLSPDQIIWMKRHRDNPPDCDDPEA